MSETGGASSQHLETKALLKILQERFAVFREFRPLAIGLDKEIRAQMPELVVKVLRQALAFHTRSTPYLKSMANATVRYRLDGSEADAVTEEHRAHATTLLKERFRKQAEKRKSELAEQKEAELRQAKLAALTDKFKRR